MKEVEFITDSLRKSFARDLYSAYSGGRLEELGNELEELGGIKTLLASVPFLTLGELSDVANLVGLVFDVSVKPLEYYTQEDLDELEYEAKYYSEEIKGYVEELGLTTTVRANEAYQAIGSQVVVNGHKGILASVTHERFGVVVLKLNKEDGSLSLVEVYDTTTVERI